MKVIAILTRHACVVAREIERLIAADHWCIGVRGICGSCICTSFTFLGILTNLPRVMMADKHRSVHITRKRSPDEHGDELGIRCIFAVRPR